jgi:hypothetical protein
MEIAYIISAYKYPQQLLRLINRLNTDKTYFLIHIDRKTHQEIYLQIVQVLSKNSNVFFLKRHDCYWGDYGHVLASIKGIQAIFKLNINCDYIKLLTGQDYPIKSNIKIQNFLRNANNNSFVNFFPLPHDQWVMNGGLNRLEYWWNVRIFHKRFNFNRVKRKLPKSFKPFGGSSYWLFSRECAEYINNFVNINKNFVKFFRNVYIPDELFFQTILMNSPLKEKIINNDLLYTDWSSNGASPDILCKTHFHELTQSSCLFARKFDETQDSEILDLIDKHLLNEGYE